MAAADVRADPEISPDAGIPKPELNVTARPVDTYVKPVEAQHSALGQLAASLKDFNPVLSKLQERFQQIETQQGTAQADEAFAKDKGNWDQAVQNGDIPSFLHPYGRLAARERFGRMAGDKMAGDIQSDQQYIQENQNATTIEQHDSAWSNARQRWEAKNLGHASHSDPLFQAHFQEMATAHTQDARNRAVPEIEKNYVRINGLHLADEMTAHMDSMLNEGSTVSSIQDALSNMASDPSLPELVRRGALSKALDAMARKRNDPSVYSLADGITVKGSDGQSYNLSNDPDFADLRFKGQSELARADLTEKRDERARLVETQEATRGTAVSTILDALEKDPAGQPDMAALERLYNENGLGDKIGELNQVVAAVRKGEVPTGAQARVLHDLTANLRDPSIHRTDQNYVSTPSLIYALKNNQISVADYRQLQEEVDKRDKKGRSRGGSDVEDHTHIFDRVYAMAKQSFSPQAGLRTKAFGGDMQAVQNQALHDITVAYRNYIAKHPDDDSGKVEDYLFARFQSFYKAYVIPGGKPESLSKQMGEIVGNIGSSDSTK